MRVRAGLVVLTVLGAFGGVVAIGQEPPPLGRTDPKAVRLP